MSLTPEEREKVAEQARITMNTQMKVGLGFGLKIVGCMGLGLVVLMLVTCTALLPHH